MKTNQRADRDFMLPVSRQSTDSNNHTFQDYRGWPIQHQIQLPRFCTSAFLIASNPPSHKYPLTTRTYTPPQIGLNGIISPSDKETALDILHQTAPPRQHNDNLPLSFPFSISDTSPLSAHISATRLSQALPHLGAISH
jgi:hypothetical protein